jgi:RNA polymerase sigma-B factor
VTKDLQRRLQSREEFAALATGADPDARNRLVESHMGLAWHLARRFASGGEPLDDLVQVASLALVNAVDRFDPERGVQFSTFATKTIIGELKRYFRDKGWSVRAPRRLQELYLEVRDAEADLSQRLGRSPMVDELAGACGCRPTDVLEALEAGKAYRSISIDAPSGDEDPLADRLGFDVDDQLLRAEFRSDLSP